MKSYPQSTHWMERSQQCFPGGVNSPVRSFQSVGGGPLVFARGEGKYLFDVDGNRFVDFCSSWGPLILGYSHPRVVRAVQEQATQAMTFGAPSTQEVLLAEKMKSYIPGLELLRFVSSGTEATMSAVRVARAATGRDRIVKCEGCYHGHADAFLVKAGSGLATLGNPSSAGVPRQATADTLVVPYNDTAALQELFAREGDHIAAFIVEPVAANMGLVLPQEGYLQAARALTQRHGALLIFDEVMTGFRIAKGGCQEVFGIKPDLWTFGKVIGGGLPAAAYGGRRDVMSCVAPLGAAYQAGTLSGNPLALAAGLATLEEMERIGAFALLEKKGCVLDSLVQSHLASLITQGAVSYVRIGSFFGFFFGTPSAPQNFAQVSQTRMDMFQRVYQAWLAEGLYFGPSGFEVGFLSTCIENDDLEKLVAVLKQTLS